MLARITCEVLGPVPAEGELSAAARVIRAGRSVELLEAELAADGRTAMRATAWRVRPAPITAGPPGGPAAPPRPPAERPLPDGWRREGYLAAVEWRFARGDWAQPGPAAVWSRLRVGIVEGEEPSPLQRLLAVADSGNGASSELDLRSWLFINPELTVHVLRAPRGEWICLDSTTTIHAGGTGTALSVLSDDDGPVAHGTQSLLVAPR